MTQSVVELNQEHTTQTTGNPDELYLDTLHCDVVDHPDDSAGPGHGQQRMVCVGVVGPGTRIEVLICLYTHLVKEIQIQELLL